MYGAVAADAFVENVDVEEIGIPVRSVEERPAEHEAVRADGGKGVRREGELEPVALVLGRDLETGPRAGDAAGTVVVAREEADGVVHPEKGEVARGGRVVRTHRVGDRFGGDDLRIREGRGHARKPRRVGEDVVAVHEGDDLAVRGLDAGGLAGLAGLEGIVGDHVRAVLARDLQRAVGGAGVGDHDLAFDARREGLRADGAEALRERLLGVQDGDDERDAHCLEAGEVEHGARAERAEVDEER